MTSSSPPDDQDNVDARFAELIAGMTGDDGTAPARRSGEEPREGASSEDVDPADEPARDVGAAGSMGTPGSSGSGSGPGGGNRGSQRDARGDAEKDGEPDSAERGEASDQVIRGHLLGEPIPHRPYPDREYPPELDEHFEPPDPPIPTTGNYYTAYAWAAIILCPITLFAFMLARISLPDIMTIAIVAIFFAACAYLILRDPHPNSNSNDNGARV